jgi:hypothetical protein
MNRSHAFRIAAGCVIAAVSFAGCRGSAGGLPPAGPAGMTQGAPPSAGAPSADPKAATRAMPFSRVGKSNTVTADMPVPRPDTTPCTVKLFSHYVFKNFNNKTFSYNPPAQCPGPWSEVVFNFDVRVTKGVQFDRTGIIWVDGAVVYFGTTAEPSPNLGPHWHVERDVTDLSALFTQASQGQVELWNCYCPPNYNAYQIGTAYVQFYPPDSKYPAPRVADQVVGIPYNPPLGGVATLPQNPMQIATALPTNIVRADLDLYLQSQNKEEQWFMCVPNDVWRHSKDALGFCRNTAFREGVVTVDKQPAGLAAIYPWIYTGGMDPYLWFPIPGVQTLEFVPFRVDLTPFAGLLSNGATHTIDVRVVRAFNYFSGAGDLLLYLDPKKATLTGRLTKDTLREKIEPTVRNTIQYLGGTGLFGGQTAQGGVTTSSRTDYEISGYVVTSSGKVSTTVTGRARFSNDQTFNYTSSSYVQRVEQRTHFDTISATQHGGHVTSLSASYDFPFSVGYPILPTSTGYKLPIKVYQGYDAATDVAGGRDNATQTSNTVVSKDTMIFDKSFNWIGVKNGASEQLYTYQSKHPAICYGKQIKSKNNVVTSIGQPGCMAPPPH